jgi:hypothetical protein
MLELPAHPIAHHRAAHLTPNDKTRSGDRSACSRLCEGAVTLGLDGLNVEIGEG